MTAKNEYKIISSNKSERSITIQTPSGLKYRSARLSKEDFIYYKSKYATANAIKEFLKSNDCYKLNGTKTTKKKTTAKKPTAKKKTTRKATPAQLAALKAGRAKRAASTPKAKKPAKRSVRGLGELYYMGESGGGKFYIVKDNTRTETTERRYTTNKSLYDQYSDPKGKDMNDILRKEFAKASLSGTPKKAAKKTTTRKTPATQNLKGTTQKMFKIEVKSTDPRGGTEKWELIQQHGVLSDFKFFLENPQQKSFKVTKPK
jgi:hypothetical protein